MDIATINKKLALGEIHLEVMFPHVARLAEAPFIFNVDFGLKALPKEPGILMIRGARQYGKSTWLEQALLDTIKTFGPGSGFYLNGEYIVDVESLEEEVLRLVSAFSKEAGVRRIFIDEITAIPQWEIALKRMADRGSIRDVLLVTTGSKATDLRRGTEKLPGRKGKLARTTYLFTPIAYGEFKRVCGDALGKNTLPAYLLSGGSPIACAELGNHGILPEYLIELVRDWVDGEMVATGRARQAMMNIMSVLFRLGGTPVGQAKLAREAGLANNSIAAGYVEILSDLGCVIPAYPWDQHRDLPIMRKSCKYHFTNLLVAVAYYKQRLRTLDDFFAMSEQEQGMWYEWLVAQELQRRAAIANAELLAPQLFWQNKSHEIDFVVNSNELIEVKRGRCSALEFSWFQHQFPQKQLTVINPNTFTSKAVRGQCLEDFLLEDSTTRPQATEIVS